MKKKLLGVAMRLLGVTLAWPELLMHTGAGETDSNLHDKVFEICSKLELLLLLSDIVHCKRIRPLISDCSKFKTRKFHVTLKYGNDTGTTGTSFGTY